MGFQLTEEVVWVDLLVHLVALLSKSFLSLEEDKWVWGPDDGDSFTDKSAYSVIAKVFMNEENLDLLNSCVFRHVWKSSAPTKTIAFSWKLLHNRIPTRSDLAQRGVIPS